LRNAGAADASFAADRLVADAMKASIGGKDFGSRPKCLFVSVQRRFHMIFVGRISVQDTVLRDQAMSTLGQKDLVAKFDRLVRLPALNQIRVSLKDRVDLF